MGALWARVSRVPVKLSVDCQDHATNRRLPVPDPRAPGVLKIDWSIDERGQSDAIEEVLCAAWQRHPCINWLGNRSCLSQLRAALVQPVDVDTSTGRSILGHKVLDAHPVLDMVEVLVDPDGTLRSHEVACVGSLGVDEPAGFLADCKQASRAQCDVAEKAVDRNPFAAIIENPIIVEDVICEVVHASSDAL